jgi:hypothetical protein
LKKRECEEQKERWRIKKIKNKIKNWIEKKNWRGRGTIRKRERTRRQGGQHKKLLQTFFLEIKIKLYYVR